MADYGSGVKENSPAFAAYSQYPSLAPNLRDPERLKGLLLIYRQNAARGDEAQAKDFTSRAMLVKNALRDLYGVEYEAPGFTSGGR